jgi:hypothetical protein
VKQIRRQAIDVQAAHHVADVERSGADLYRGGRRHGRAAAGVSLASRTSLPP